MENLFYVVIHQDGEKSGIYEGFDALREEARKWKGQWKDVKQRIGFITYGQAKSFLMDEPIATKVLPEVISFLTKINTPLPLEVGRLVRINAFGEGYVREIKGKKAKVYRHNKGDEWSGNIKELTVLDTELSLRGIDNIITELQQSIK